MVPERLFLQFPIIGAKETKLKKCVFLSKNFIKNMKMHKFYAPKTKSSRCIISALVAKN